MAKYKSTLQCLNTAKTNDLMVKGIDNYNNTQPKHQIKLALNTPIIWRGLCIVIFKTHLLLSIFFAVVYDLISFYKKSQCPLLFTDKQTRCTKFGR